MQGARRSEPRDIWIGERWYAGQGVSGKKTTLNPRPKASWRPREGRVWFPAGKNVASEEEQRVRGTEPHAREREEVAGRPEM